MIAQRVLGVSDYAAAALDTLAHRDPVISLYIYIYTSCHGESNFARLQENPPLNLQPLRGITDVGSAIRRSETKRDVLSRSRVSREIYAVRYKDE